MSSGTLGAILAGGQSRRFGSDKLLARIDGRPLIDHVCAAIAPQVDAIVLCGGRWPGLTTIDDRPDAGLGPLGGLNAALHHAARQGFAAVLVVPIDVHPLPADLRTRLGTAPAVLAGQWAVGLWPAALSPALDAHLADGHRSMRSWIGASGARRVDDDALGLRNINRPDDLM